MQLAVSDLQTKHRLLVEALNRGESVQLTYRGKVLGVVTPDSQDKGSEAAAMSAFLGMHKSMGVDSVEEELRCVRCR